MPTHWIYLHGFGSSPRSQKAAFFERKFAGVNLPFVVPDLNVPTFENLTMTAMLEKVDEVIGALPPDARVGIVGSSLGGLLALFAAERHADRVTRLFLMAPALALFRSNFVGMGRVGMKRWEREGYVEVHHYGTERTERLSYEFVRDAHRYDESKVNLHLPILIVHGTHDETVDPHLSVLYAKRNPNVRLHLVEDDHTLIASCTEMWEWLWREIRPKQPGSAEA